MHSCTVCGTKFTRKDNLEEHVKAVHEGIKRFQCSHCEYMTAFRSNMKKHEISLHADTVSELHQCQRCDKKFASMGSLNQHVRGAHEGIKPYQCAQCNHKTDRKSSLNKHIQHMHERVKHYVCDLCEKVNYFRSCLKTRDLFVHPFV